MAKKYPVLFFLITCLYLINFNKVSVHADISDDSTISTTVTGTTLPLPEEEKLIIFGYGPSFSDIYMEGIGVSENTKTLEDGYFEFNSLTFPTLLSSLVGNLYPEICIWSKDLLDRKTPPTCIPPLSLAILTRKIGPILLAPTLGIESSKIPQGKQIIAYGTTTPNTEVNIFLAKKDTKSIFNIIPEISAYSLPKYTINSNQKGYFEFTLPTSDSDNWKVYAASNFQGNNTPKSYTLSFDVKGPIMTIIETYEDTLRGKRPSYLIIIIVIEILIIIVLSITTSKETHRHKKHKRTKHHNVSKNISQLQNKYSNLQKEYEDILRKKNKDF
ncbi:MAG: hypothetical protein ABIJ05_03470 [Patescibacteria group bacterium]